MLDSVEHYTAWEGVPMAAWTHGTSKKGQCAQVYAYLFQKQNDRRWKSIELDAVLYNDGTCASQGAIADAGKLTVSISLATSAAGKPVTLKSRAIPLLLYTL